MLTGKREQTSLSVVGQARRNESRRDWGESEVGGDGGVKRVEQRPANLEEEGGDEPASPRHRASEETPFWEWAVRQSGRVGGKVRRKWKCGRWEGATDGGQHASTQLSLAEPSQTGMSALPQVGAAWTLGEAATGRPSIQERWQGPGAVGD